MADVHRTMWAEKIAGGRASLLDCLTYPLLPLPTLPKSWRTHGAEAGFENGYVESIDTSHSTVVDVEMKRQ
jgi:hypothetical protein